MDTTTSPIVDLDPSDFDRLGVRPQECRLTVIRRATMRAASMVSPTEDVRTSELSKVAASAYRLLDPRRRMDAVERAHVGRILPGALLAAGSTKFHSGPFSGEILDGTDEDVTAPVLVGDSAITETVHHEPWSLESARHSLTLNSRICVKDLVGRYESARRLDRYRQWMQHPRTIVALIVALVLTTGWLAVWQYQNRSRIVRSIAATRQVDIKPDVIKPDVIKPDVIKPRVVPETVDADRTMPALDVRKPLPENRGTDDSMGKPGLTPDAGPPAIHSLGSPSTPLTTERAVPRRMLQPPSDRVMWIRSKESLKPPPSVSLSTPRLATKRHPAYTRSDCEISISGLLSELIKLEFLENQSDLFRLHEDVNRTTVSMTVGSAEHWSAEMIASSVLWFGSEPKQLLDRWQKFSEVYDVGFVEYVQQSFQTAVGLRCSLSLQKALVGQGLVVGHWMLRDSGDKVCENIGTELLPLARTLNRDTDVTQLEWLMSAAKQAKRSSAKVADRDRMDNASKSDAGIIGRHLCFLAQSWPEGLKWLARGSDMRLAGLARQEIELLESRATAAQEWRSIAKLWQTYADGLSGHNQQTTNMHVVDLLGRAIELSSPVDELRWSREREQIRDSIPESLRIASGLTRVTNFQREDVGGQSSHLNDTRERSLQAPNEPIYLDGRVTTVGGQPLVRLHYQVGGTIHSLAMIQMKHQPGWSLLPLHWDLTGNFTQATPGLLGIEVNVALRGSQTVYVDGELVEIDPLDGVGRCQVSEGRHSIRWVVDANSLETRFLSMHR